MAKIEKPDGVTLGANQSWNKQHGYVQTDYKHCDKDVLKAAYNAAGRPALLTWIKEQANKGVAIPSYPTCVAWMETKGENTEAEPALVHQSPIVTLDDVEASYKKSIEALITSLLGQEKQLQAALERVTNDLARAREKLTKFD